MSVEEQNPLATQKISLVFAFHVLVEPLVQAVEQ